MTTATPEDLAHSGADAQTRQAWATYRENLVELDGVAYDEAERSEWEHLQTELREITAARSDSAAPPGA